MTAVYSLNLVDRGLIMLLLQPIKEDLQLSDSQLGFLTGIAFGLFYATLGLPIARWADRGNRVTITSLAIGFWGLAVMATLFVTNFFQLFVARVAAAVGEAGCNPPTYSLLGDYFPEPAERSRALAIYFAGGPLSAMVSFIVGGWLNELYGWRIAFLVMGVPGLILAVLIKLTIIEPRTHSDGASSAPRDTQPMAAVLATLWRQPTLRHLCIALILFYTVSMGLSPWYAAFMIRIHHMGTAKLGIWLGIVAGAGGMAGCLLGGYVAGRWLAGNERAQLRMCAVAVIALVPCFVAFLTVPHQQQALLVLIPLFLTFNASMGPTYAILQRLVCDPMRATMMSVVMLLANLIGMGLGPQIVGILSDLFAPTLGPESLRYAMLCMSFVALWSGFHFWRAGRSVQEDLSSVADIVAVKA